MEKSQLFFLATFKPTKRILKIGRQLGILACPSYLCVYFFFIYRDAFNCRFQLNCIFNRKLCCIVTWLYFQWKEMKHRLVKANMVKILELVVNQKSWDEFKIKLSPISHTCVQMCAFSCSQRNLFPAIKSAVGF